ncbi:hypothetical protein TRFO_30186 [Tritrichomonas foetus]|uniref:Uncharacterized protein n=1 Tax=Tritrichomonas foetus TaxID=1144522 RepID=A0A1J4JU59_9EUKA|nr:hypothetical protein TRFO_30186 [Tritrichomonas foetus]|eukprot:OHT02687.1 hypothetical protein TRFO_30186 [Tritrichomonas foetus]
MENITPEQILVESDSQEKENNEPDLNRKEDEKECHQRKKQCCGRRCHWRRHYNSNNDKEEGEEECFDVPPPLWVIYRHGKFGRHLWRRNERKCYREEESENDEKKEALNNQIRETKKQLKALIIQKLQKQFPDYPTRKLHKIAKRIMFHKLCKFGRFGPRNRPPYGIHPPPVPQFLGAPRQCELPPQQGSRVFPVCERPKIRNHERRHVHNPKRRECEKPLYGPWGRQFGGLCERQQCHIPFGGRCERPPYLHLGEYQRPPHSLCGLPPPHRQGGRHEMKGLMRWRMARCQMPPLPFGPWGRPEFGSYGPEMRHWWR